MNQRRILLPGEPVEEGVQISEGTEQEFEDASKIKVTDPKTGGVEYDPWAKRQAEWIERNFDDPGTLIDENVPFDFWLAVADHITQQIKSTTSMTLRVVRDKARKWAQAMHKNKVNGMSPQRAQMDLRDMYVYGCKSAEELKWLAELMRCWRLACYTVFQREYLNRRVG
jgi:hypothetical protein